MECNKTAELSRLATLESPGGEPAGIEPPFRALFEEAPIAYHELDAAGIVRYVNKAECRLLGLRQEEIIGRYAWDLLPATDREACRARLQSKLGGTILEHPRYVVRRRGDGTLGTFSLHERLVRDGGGRITGIRTALVDVTEQRQSESVRQEAERELRLSEERFRVAAENASDLIFEWNLATGNLEFFGRRPDGGAALPRTLGEWKAQLHPADRPRVMQAVRAHVETQQLFCEEFRILTKDGRVEFWSVRASRLQDENGGATRSIGTANRRHTEAPKRGGVAKPVARRGAEPGERGNHGHARQYRVRKPQIHQGDRLHVR